jgi:hypothetical protein
MLTSNKKWYAGIAIVIAALLVSLTLFAQNQPKKNNSMNHTYDSSWWNSNVPEKYWLSNNQINQVNKIKTEYDGLRRYGLWNEKPRIYGLRHEKSPRYV